MIAQVVPVKRGAISLPFFDYLVPEKSTKAIKIGQLVKIPLRKKEEFGIVINLIENNTSQFAKIKEITSIVHNKPFFNAPIINFFIEIGALYHCSLGSLIKTGLLPLKKRKLEKLPADLPVFPISDTKFGKPAVFIYKDIEAKLKFIEDKIDLTKQTLIIVPEISDADKLYESLPKKLRDLTTIYTSQISEKEMFEKWLGIWNGETKIIIGTRNTIFLSYFSLTEIIIDQSFHFGHKSWDAAPRFNSKDAALILAKHLGAHLSLISHTPSVEEFYFATNDVYSFFDEKLPGIKRLPSVINMKQEFRAKNFSNFSLPLQDEINNNKTGSIFLYCNRRGSASYVSCRDCAKVLKCNVCSRPYIYYEKFSELRCHHCNTKTAMNPTCSECKGTNLAFYGAGTSGIAAEYKKLFPDEKREILEIDKDIFDLDTFNDNKDRVIIGTQFAWSYLNWNNISVMAMMDADTPLYTPEYLGSENLWFSIHDAIFRLPEQSSLYIQTRHSDHPVYEYLNSPQLFYDRELAERKLFGYPPFKFLLKLFLSDENAGNLDKECRKFYQNLQQLTKNSPDIKINSPVSIFPPIIKGKYSQAIIIKLSYKNYKKSLKHILEITPDNWKADPNPINLLSL